MFENVCQVRDNRLFPASGAATFIARGSALRALPPGKCQVRFSGLDAGTDGLIVQKQTEKDGVTCFPSLAAPSICQTSSSNSVSITVASRLWDHWRVRMYIAPNCKWILLILVQWPQ